MNFLELKNVTLERGGRNLVRGLDLTLMRGQVIAILGKNGVGKTTLLHSIMALHPIAAGSILLNEQPLHTIDRTDLACTVGLLFQELPSDMPATVLETVLLGRHPHQESLFRESQRDQDIACQALADMGISHLAQRQIDQLSGGEKQRVALALLLAQAPELYLLDEPGNHLDIAFQMQLLRFLRKHASSEGRAMIVATHDINLAVGFADDVLLMMEDGRHIAGASADVLNTDNLAAVFGCEFIEIRQDSRRFFLPR